MKTTERFDNAERKLYNAFNGGRLNAMDPCACAVGNMCDNSSNWGCYEGLDNGVLTKPVRDIQGSLIETKETIKTGYTQKQLSRVEHLFLKSCDFGEKKQTAESQLNGLIDVLNYLAELDGIESIETQYKKFEAVLTREMQTV